MSNIKLIRIDLEGVQGLSVAVEGDIILVPMYVHESKIPTNDASRYEVALKVADILLAEVWHNAEQYPDIMCLANDMVLAGRIRRVIFLGE